MYCPRFELACFESLPVEARIGILHALLEVLVLANRATLRMHPSTPPLASSGVRYLKEPAGTDNWQDLPRTLQLRSGDCEDVCAWRVAELREAGEAGAGFVVRTYQRGTLTFYHVLVGRADGSTEDVSRALGMP